MHTNASKTLESNVIYDKKNAKHGLQRSSTQQQSWFALLRSRFSQLNMPEWLTQLGIGSVQHQHTSPITSTSVAPEAANLLKRKSKSVCVVEDKQCLTTNSDFLKSHNDTMKSLTKQISDSSVKNQIRENFEETLSDCSVDMWTNTEEYEDTLVLQHFGPLKNLYNYTCKPGKGHCFISLSSSQPTWCDKCGDFMWGFLTSSVKCENCNYTCHAKCVPLVTLDCKTTDSSAKSSEIMATLLPKSVSSNLYPDLKSIFSIEETEDSVNCLNSEIMENSSSSKGDEIEQKSYFGQVQIHMNFTRPVNVVAEQSAFTLTESTLDNFNTKSVKTITTFFLPRNTIKNVNISSEMTTREMIVILLRKFKVADNPRKFALYERSLNEFSSDVDFDEVKFVRVSDDAFPLKIVRSWQQEGVSKQLILQENDTGDILWDMFEIPELQNFLTILADEERQYSFQVRQKYAVYKCHLDAILKQHGYYLGDGKDNIVFSEDASESKTEQQNLTTDSSNKEYEEQTNDTKYDNVEGEAIFV